MVEEQSHSPQASEPGITNEDQLTSQSQSSQQSPTSLSPSSMMSFSDLFSKAWKQFTGAFGQFMGLYFSFFGIILGLEIVLLIIIFSTAAFGSTNIKQLIEQGTFSLDALSLATVGVVILLLFILFVLVVSAWMQASALLAVKEVDEHKTFKVGDSMKKGWKYVWPLLGLTILVGLITTIGWVLVIIPGIILSVFLAFVAHVHIFEEKGIIDSMKRSWRLAKPHFWKLLGRGALFMLIAFLSYLVVMLVSLLPFVGVLVAIFWQASVFGIALLFSYQLYKELIRLQ